MFKCFCNFLEKKFLFNKRLDNIFKNLNENGKQSDFINELNDLINNYGEWDLVVWSIPWSGEGRTLDYGIDINNKLEQQIVAKSMGEAPVHNALSYLKDKDFNIEISS